MKKVYVREMTEEERQAVEKGLRSGSAFMVRRSQIILSSAGEKRKAQEIGEHLRVSDQCVRNVIKAFEREGVKCLEEKRHARKDNQSGFDLEGLAGLKELVRQSPRSHGHESSIWTLEMLAQTCWEEKISTRPISVSGVSGGLR